MTRSLRHSQAAVLCRADVAETQLVATASDGALQTLLSTPRAHSTPGRRRRTPPACVHRRCARASTPLLAASAPIHTAPIHICANPHRANPHLRQSTLHSSMPPFGHLSDDRTPPTALRPRGVVAIASRALAATLLCPGPPKAASARSLGSRGVQRGPTPMPCDIGGIGTSIAW